MNLLPFRIIAGSAYTYIDALAYTYEMSVWNYLKKVYYCEVNDSAI